MVSKKNFSSLSKNVIFPKFGPEEGYRPNYWIITFSRKKMSFMSFSLNIGNYYSQFLIFIFYMDETLSINSLFQKKPLKFYGHTKWERKYKKIYILRWDFMIDLLSLERL